MKGFAAIIVILLVLYGCNEVAEQKDVTIPVVEDVQNGKDSGATSAEANGTQQAETLNEDVKETPSEEESSDEVNPIEVYADLMNFPEMFLGELNGKTVSNAIIVVGRKAPPKDVISAMEVATALNELVEERQYSVKTKMDDEIGKVTDANYIVIGNPCDNPKSRELTGISDCNADLAKGKAMVKLYEKDGRIQMLIVGYDADGTYKASQKIAGYKKQALKGKSFVFSYS